MKRKARAVVRKQMSFSDPSKPLGWDQGFIVGPWYVSVRKPSSGSLYVHNNGKVYATAFLYTSTAWFRTREQARLIAREWNKNNA